MACSCRKIFTPFAKLFKELLTQPLIFAFTLLYFSDIFSDVTLGIRHLLNDNVWWGGLTLTFVAMPLLYALFCSLIDGRRQNFFHSDYNVAPLFAILGLHPIAHKLKASMSTSREERQEWRYMAVDMLVVELVFETIPQLILQLYIVGHTNEVDLLTILTIFTSLLSISVNGVNNQVIVTGFKDNIVPRMTAINSRNLVAVSIILPWLLFQISSLLPSFSFSFRCW